MKNKLKPILTIAILAGLAWLPLATAEISPIRVDTVPEAGETADVGMRIVEDHVIREDVMYGSQLADCIVQRSHKDQKAIRKALSRARKQYSRIQPTEVREDFNDRKYWHTLHVVDHPTLDALAGSWSEETALSVVQEYGFRIVRYSQSSLVLDDRGQVIAVMVRVRIPGELRRYPIFLSEPFLEYYSEQQYADPYTLSDVIFLALLEASTVDSYVLAETSYVNRSYSLVVESAQYVPAIFWVDYTNDRYYVHNIYYTWDSYRYDPWCPHNPHYYDYYYDYYGYYPYHHYRKHRKHYRDPLPPHARSGKERLYDRHDRRGGRSGRTVASRSRERDDNSRGGRGDRGSDRGDRSRDRGDRGGRGDNPREDRYRPNAPDRVSPVRGGHDRGDSPGRRGGKGYVPPNRGPKDRVDEPHRGNDNYRPPERKRNERVREPVRNDRPPRSAEKIERDVKRAYRPPAVKRESKRPEPARSVGTYKKQETRRVRSEPKRETPTRVTPPTRETRRSEPSRSEMKKSSSSRQEETRSEEREKREVRQTRGSSRRR
jgi:hypothetical protein